MKTNEELYEEMKMVQYRMNNEGFHYCFKHYSNFQEIDDEHFHKLRNDYLRATKELENYINQTVDDLYDLYDCNDE